MAITRPTGEQLRFNSASTGEHILDTYMEAAEIGGRTLSDLLDDLFDPSDNGTFRSSNFEFRYSSNKMQFRAGIYSNSSASWVDVTTFFTQKGAFSNSTAYNNFDMVTMSNSDVYLVHELTSATTFNSENAFKSSNKTTKMVDVSAAQAQAAIASDHRADAAKYAVTAEDATFSLTSTNGGTSGLYSAKHYQAKANANATTATTQAGLASDQRADAAKYTNTAHGSTFTLTSTNGGTSGLYSALHYSTEASRSASADTTVLSTGSAKAWALGGGSGFTTTTAVSGSDYSAKYYADQASSSATTASGHKDDASTSATASAGSATASAGSATSAAGSAAAAATSASAAAVSASSVKMTQIITGTSTSTNKWVKIATVTLTDLSTQIAPCGIELIFTGLIATSNMHHFKLIVRGSHDASQRNLVVEFSQTNALNTNYSKSDFLITGPADTSPATNEIWVRSRQQYDNIYARITPAIDENGAWTSAGWALIPDQTSSGWESSFTSLGNILYAKQQNIIVGKLSVQSSTDEANLELRTSVGGSEPSGRSPDLMIYTDATYTGDISSLIASDNHMGVVQYVANDSAGVKHQVADLGAIFAKPTANAMAGALEMRFAEGSSEAWSRPLGYRFQKEHIHYWAGSYHTALQFTTPTANKTLTVPNETGTIATQEYVNTQVTGEDTLAEMNDTDIDNVGNNEILQYKTSSSKWENQTFAEAGILTANQTITLSGDVSGSGTTAITVTVADDSHNHIIGNVDGLQTALDAKAPLASPDLTGNPTAPTQTAGNNSTRIATTAYTDTAISNLVDSAPGTLNTLNELAAALGDDASFSTTVTNSIATKMPLAGGTFTDDVTFTGANYNAVWQKSNNALDFADGAKIWFGSSNDLEIQHIGGNSNSVIKNYTNNLSILNYANNKDISIYSDDGNGGVTEYVVADGSEGEVKLYHAASGSSSIKLTTKSTGVEVTGTVTDDGATHDGDVTFTGANYNVVWNKSDNALEVATQAKVTFGGGAEIFVNQYDNTIFNVTGNGDATNHLYLQNLNDDKSVYIRTNGGGQTQDYVRADGATGEVVLSHYGSTKLATKSTGIDVTGTVTADGLTLGDSNTIKIGAGDDLQLYHNATNSVIANHTGHLYLVNGADNTDIIFMNDDGSGETTNYFVIDGDAETVISEKPFIANSTTTLNDDVTFTGTSYNVVWDKSDNALEFGDNAELRFGADNDLVIRHNETHSQIKDLGTGKLQICGSSVQIKNSANTESMLTCASNGAVTLHYDNSAKFETTNTGTKVTGDLETTGDIELGHASDTTITRDSAGVVKINTDTVLTTGNADAGSPTTSSSDADYVLIDDGGVLKRITPANLGITSSSGASEGFAIAMAICL